MSVWIGLGVYLTPSALVATWIGLNEIRYAINKHNALKGFR